MNTLHEIWNSTDRLEKLITLANWGIALSLLLGFAFTAIVIKAGNRKDELSAAEDLKAAGKIAQLGLDTEHLKATNLQLGTDLEKATAESTRRQTELEVEQRKTAIAQADSAKAQLALKEHVDRVARQAASRSIDGPKFVMYVRALRKVHVNLLYNPNDSEALIFATQIFRWLSMTEDRHGAGWDVSEPQPIPLRPGLPTATPADAQYSGTGSATGITILTHSFDIGPGSPSLGLSNALFESMGQPESPGNGSAAFGIDKSIPMNSLTIVIGKKS